MGMDAMLTRKGLEMSMSSSRALSRRNLEVSGAKGSIMRPRKVTLLQWYRRRISTAWMNRRTSLEHSQTKESDSDFAKSRDM